jgi:diphosphomevalonate decarboxylase
LNKVTWQSPSNIALVKYWGKYDNQIPANPSISFTLNASNTTTTLSWKEKEADDNFDFEVWFEGQLEDSFRPKIEAFFKRINHMLPFLKRFSFKIETSNTFPHSSGIASSASGLSALSLCFASMAQSLNIPHDEDFYRFASTLSRLGSGSASRSIFGNLVVWGKHLLIDGSSDNYATPLSSEVHQVFENFQDTILLVDKGEKQVSSTVGHGLMNDHPYASKRFEQASENLSKMKAILSSGDLDAFGNLVESEALTLHAMMMTSNPYFILMKPNTLRIIEEIWKFRKETKTPVYFTLDAGANVHMLFPEMVKNKVDTFTKSKLVGYCKNEEYICDQIGQGPKQL